jgi:broad specificity phosphatase PhoE
MDNKLVLIRHSVPELDPSIPPNQWMLNEVGKDKARQLARQLSTHSIACVMSSSEPKAIETAQIIASHLGQLTQVAPGLHEHKRPQTKLTSERIFKKTIAKLFADPDNLTFGTETANEAGQRFDRAVRALLQLYPDQGLAIVSHGTVMAMYASFHMKVDPHSIWQHIGLPGALIFSRPQFQLRVRLSPVKERSA